MSTDNHAAGFRPSHFPALEKCIHHQSKEAGEAAERGCKIHEIIAQVFKTGLPPQYHPEIMTAGEDAVNPGAVSPVKWAYWLVQEYLEQDWKIFAVEHPVDILDEFGEKISNGTIDLVLERNREFLIVDWKTGDKGDYGNQLAAYQAAWWDLHPESKSVHALVAFVDLRETESATFSFQWASDIVLGLYSKWSNKQNEPYTINPYCDWCAIRGDCPAWREEASSALLDVSQLAVNDSGLPDGPSVVQAKVDSLKNDPNGLETFLLAWERCKTLVDDEWNLKDALKTHMSTGFKADHFLLVTVKDKSEVVESLDAEKYLQTVVKEIGTMKAAQAVKVDPHKAVEAWKSFTDKPFPLTFSQTITEKPGYSYVRLKGKPGAGAARKKRKELE